VTVASLAHPGRRWDEAAGLAEHCTQRMVEIVDDRLAWPRMVAWLPTTRPSSFGYFHSPSCGSGILDYWRTAPPDLGFVTVSSVRALRLESPATVKILDFR